MSDYLLENQELSPGKIYRLFSGSICPRPIAWVSTLDDQGNANLAPFSFFNVVSVNPPVLGFSPLLDGDATPRTPFATWSWCPNASCISAVRGWFRR